MFLGFSLCNPNVAAQPYRIITTHPLNNPTTPTQQPYYTSSRPLRRLALFRSFVNITKFSAVKNTKNNKYHFSTHFTISL